MSHALEGAIVFDALPAVLGCFVPTVLLSNKLVYIASNMALSMAIHTQKAVVSDEQKYLPTTLILQGLLMTIACSWFWGFGG